MTEKRIEVTARNVTVRHEGQQLVYRFDYDCVCGKTHRGIERMHVSDKRLTVVSYGCVGGGVTVRIPEVEETEPHGDPPAH